MNKKIAFLSLLICTSPSFASNDDIWDRVRFEGLTTGKYYDISSGTGFYVNNNYIVTNAHVLQNCLNIAVRGAVPPTRATLVKADPEVDLALIYTQTQAPLTPYLRANFDLKQDDLIFIMGFPLSRGETGDYLVVPAKVIGFEGETFDNARHIEFTNSVEHGNSGGPVIDKSGNIIGVVVAKKTKVTIETFPTGETKQTEELSSVAISLSYLKNFLNKNNINYISNTTYDILYDYRPDKRAVNYIVNIHCIQESTDNSK